MGGIFVCCMRRGAGRQRRAERVSVCPRTLVHGSGLKGVHSSQRPRFRFEDVGLGRVLVDEKHVLDTKGSPRPGRATVELRGPGGSRRWWYDVVGPVAHRGCCTRSRTSLWRLRILLPSARRPAWPMSHRPSRWKKIYARVLDVMTLKRLRSEEAAQCCQPSASMSH